MRFKLFVLSTRRTGVSRGFIVKLWQTRNASVSEIEFFFVSNWKTFECEWTQKQSNWNYGNIERWRDVAWGFFMFFGIVEKCFSLRIRPEPATILKRKIIFQLFKLLEWDINDNFFLIRIIFFVATVTQSRSSVRFIRSDRGLCLKNAPFLTLILTRPNMETQREKKVFFWFNFRPKRKKFFLLLSLNYGHCWWADGLPFELRKVFF